MQHKFLTLFFEKLNEYNIRYCVLRNYHSLPQSTDDSDLDIWVDESDLNVFFKVIEICNVQLNSKIVSYIWKRFEPKICLMGLDWSIQIDIYKEIVPIQEYPFFFGDTIRNNTIELNNIKVLNKTWSDLESFLKEILNTGDCTRKTNFYSDAQFAVKQLDIDALKKNLKLFSSEFINLLNQLPNINYNKDTIKTLYKLGIRDIKSQKNIYKLDKFRKYKRIIRKPGYLIAILGTDGSGKTTIINSIVPILAGAFHNGIHYSHLRPHLLPDIGVVLKRRNNSASIETQPHAKKTIRNNNFTI